MKKEITIEYGGKRIMESDIVAAVKEIWRAQGNRVADMTKLELFIKPEENAAYYVVNQETQGRVDI